MCRILMLQIRCKPRKPRNCPLGLDAAVAADGGGYRLHALYLPVQHKKYEFKCAHCTVVRL